MSGSRIDEILDARVANVNAGSVESTEPLRPTIKDGRSRIDQILDTRLSPNTKQDARVSRFIGQGDLGPPGLQDGAARFAVSRADTLAEKQAALQRYYPEGELMMTPVSQNSSDELLFRTDPSQPFARLDARMFERFEPVQDLIDFFGDDLGATGGEVASGLSKKALKASPVGRAARVALGAVAGDSTQQAVEEVLGENEQSLGEVAANTTGKGAGAGLGDLLIGQAAAKISNTVGGAPIVNLDERACEALVAERDLGLPQLCPDQLLQSPVVRRVANQAAALNSKIPRNTDAQFAAAQSKLDDQLGEPTVRDLRETLRLSDQRARKALNVELKAGSPNVNRETGGNVLMQSIDDFARRTQKQVVNPAYEAARRLEEPRFDLSAVKARAEEIGKGVQAPDTAGVLVDVQRRSSELNHLIDQIKSLDSQAAPFEAVKELRSRAYDLSRPPLGQRATNDNRLAGDLFRGLSGTIDSPVNSSPQFQTAWREATSLARERFEKIESLNVRGLVSAGGDPERLFDQVVRPGRAGTLRTLRAEIPSVKYKQVQQAFKTDLSADLGALRAKLDRFDDETLAQLLTKPERDAYRSLAGNLEALDDVGVQGALRRQSDNQAAMREFVDSNNTASISGMRALLRKQASNAGDADLRNVRKAMMGIIAEDATKIATDGKERVAGAALRQAMKRYRRNGAINILTTEDQKVLQSLASYLDVVRPKADIAANLSGGEAAGALVDAVTPDTGIGERVGAIKLVVSELLAQKIVSDLLTSPKFRSLVLGRSDLREPRDFLLLKTAGAVVGEISVSHSQDD